MTPAIQKNRLYLREFDSELDAKAMYELNSDAEVIRYTGDEPFTTEKEAKQFLEN